MSYMEQERYSGEADLYQGDKLVCSGVLYDVGVLQQMHEVRAFGVSGSQVPGLKRIEGGLTERDGALPFQLEGSRLTAR